MNTQQEEQQTHFNEIAKMLADGKITPELACSLIEELRDVGILADAMDAQNEEQTHFNEIADMLADGKITLEQACDLFKERIDEWQARENLVNSK
jgi:tape measure domain-containing protein